jgi:hypothetical protein
MLPTSVRTISIATISLFATVPSDWRDKRNSNNRGSAAPAYASASVFVERAQRTDDDPGEDEPGHVDVTGEDRQQGCFLTDETGEIGERAEDRRQHDDERERGQCPQQRNRRER